MLACKCVKCNGKKSMLFNGNTIQAEKLGSFSKT